MKFEEYQKLDGANASVLKEFFKSAAHVKAKIEGQDKETPAKALGSLTHQLVLQPELFDRDYVAAPDFGHLRKTDSTSSEQAKKNKEAKIAFYAEHEGKKIITADEFRRMSGILRALWDNTETRKLLESVTETEKPIQWVDPETGVECKALLDMLAPGVCLDLKTCTDARYFKFRAVAEKFGYDFSACYYFRGCLAAEIPVEHFAWICIESEEPFAPKVYRLPEGTREKFQPAIDLCLEKYKVCTATNHWPAYGGGIENLEMSEIRVQALLEFV